MAIHLVLANPFNNLGQPPNSLSGEYNIIFFPNGAFNVGENYTGSSQSRNNRNTSGWPNSFGVSGNKVGKYSFSYDDISDLHGSNLYLSFSITYVLHTLEYVGNRWNNVDITQNFSIVTSGIDINNGDSNLYFEFNYQGFTVDTNHRLSSVDVTFSQFELHWSQGCVDSRTSTPTQEVLITINGRYFPYGSSAPLPSPQVSYSHRETLSLSNTPLNFSVPLTDVYLNTLDMVTARFIDNTARGSGVINVYGKVQFYYSEFQGLLGHLVEGLDNSSIPEYLLFQIVFDDSCCNMPSGWSNNFDGMPPVTTGAVTRTYEDFLNEYDYTVYQLTRIEFVGFTALNNYCCDGSDCSEKPDNQEFIEGKYGGIDMTDISCICDNLAQLNTRVSSFVSLFEELLAEEKGINLKFGNSNTLLGSLVTFQGASNELLGSLVSIVNGKDMSPEVNVSPQITVEPCSPVVTNPVNNITVTPSTAEITVQPCSPVVTNPVNNITVTPSTAEITVQPCSPVVTNPVNNITVTPSTAEITVQPCSPIVTNPVNNITVTPSTVDVNVAPCQPIVNNVIPDSITVDNDSLVEKLDELFKKDDDTITDIVDDVFKTTYQGLDGEMHTEDITEVIRKKECENVVECIVEPVNMAYEGKGKYIDKDMLEQN